jgi:menaquinone-dependent protoporphyrinogen IX oxidase
VKTIVIFFSLDGNTRFIAETLSYQLYYDKLELRPVDMTVPKNKMMKILWGGRQVISKAKPDLKHFHLDLSEYTHLVIATPIWVGTYAPALDSFFSKVAIRDKKIALFCCHGGGGKARAFKNIKKTIPENEFVGEIEFREPLKGDPEEALDRARRWANKVLVP